MAGHVILFNIRDTVYDPGFQTEYLAFGYLAAALRSAGHRVTWIDEYADGDLDPHRYDFAAHGPVDMVAVSPSFATYRRILTWLAAWSAAFPTALRVMGGQHAMFCADEILAETDLVDAVCLGEGEEAIVALLERALGAARRPRDVAGFAYQGGEREVRPPSQPMDALPFPARDVLERWARSRRFSQVAIQNSRGCAFGCGFCHYPKARRSGQGYRERFRSPANVVTELVALNRDRGYREFFFCSPQFGGKGPEGQTWMRDFAEALIAEGRDIRIEIECRADTLEDTALVAQLRRAGLIRVFLGLEAGTDDTLQGFGKGLRTEGLERVVANLRRNDISISGSGFIMFHPEATLETLGDNLGFLDRLGETHVESLWSFFRALPGIRMNNRLEAAGLLDAGRAHDDATAFTFADPQVRALYAGAGRALAAPGLKRARRAIRLIDIEVAMEEANLPAVAPWVSPRGLADLMAQRQEAEPLRDMLAAAFRDHFQHCLRLAGRGETDFTLAGHRLERNLRGLAPRTDRFLARHDQTLHGITRRRAAEGGVA